MPEHVSQPDETQERLSNQVSAYRSEAISLISQGIEHARFEVKRICPIAGDVQKRKRAAFVKVVQGLANAHIDGERLFLIGADSREKRFYPLDDVAQYDQAKVGDLLKSALEPMPEFTVLPFETDGGEKFVVVVVASEQPRPIVCKSDLADIEEKTGLRRGEIWIKENTSLRLTNRDDFERMVKTRIDLESEARAKIRFSEYLAATDLSRTIFQRPTISLPQKDLIFGSEGGFRQFVEELIATGDGLRFRMLLELFRDELIEAWHSIGAFRITTGSTGLESRSTEYIKNSFSPSLHRLAQLALLMCKFDASLDWFNEAIDLVAQTHLMAVNLEGLPSLNLTESSLTRRIQIPAARAARVIAAYALKRQRYKFFGTCVVKYSRIRRDRSLQPLLFDWRDRTEPTDPTKVGLAGEVWDDMGSWIVAFFGSVEDMNNAFAQLEFVLEFNSFLEQGAEGVEAPAKGWFAQAGRGKTLMYISAIWRLGLGAAEPVALLLANGLQSKNMNILKHLAIEPGAFEYVLTKFAADPLEVERKYLHYLIKEQHNFFMRSRHFPPDFDWSEQLKLATGLKIEKLE